MSFVSVSIAATSGVPANEAGLASGLLNTSQQMGGALGLAILAGVASSVTQSSGQNPIEALVHGNTTAFAVASGFTIFALILAIAVIRTPKTVATPQTEPVSVH